MIGLAVTVAAVALFDAFLGFIIRWFSARIGEGLIYDLRTQVFSHVQQQPDRVLHPGADRLPGVPAEQ